MRKSVGFWGSMPPAVLLGAVLLAGAATARAADLAARPEPQPPSNCRVIPEPRLNLTQDDVVGADPQTVCFSRGLLADSMRPYPAPPHRGFFDFWP